MHTRIFRRSTTTEQSTWTTLPEGDKWYLDVPYAIRKTYDFPEAEILTGMTLEIEESGQFSIFTSLKPTLSFPADAKQINAFHNNVEHWLHPTIAQTKNSYSRRLWAVDINELRKIFRALAENNYLPPLFIHSFTESLPKMEPKLHHYTLAWDLLCKAYALRDQLELNITTPHKELYKTFSTYAKAFNQLIDEAIARRATYFYTYHKKLEFAAEEAFNYAVSSAADKGELIFLKKLLGKNASEKIITAKANKFPINAPQTPLQIEHNLLTAAISSNYFVFTDYLQLTGSAAYIIQHLTAGHSCPLCQGGNDLLTTVLTPTKIHASEEEILNKILTLSYILDHYRFTTEYYKALVNLAINKGQFRLSMLIKNYTADPATRALYLAIANGEVSPEIRAFLIKEYDQASRELPENYFFEINTLIERAKPQDALRINNYGDNLYTFHYSPAKKPEPTPAAINDDEKYNADDNNKTLAVLRI